jgi:hypothetical protein
MVASAAIGLALLAGVTREVTASTNGSVVVPPDNIRCYYHLWTCSYDGENYWSGCNPAFPEGWITTAEAKLICTVYHAD